MNPVDFEKLTERLRNWGRWGSDDQRGTLNFIGPETLRSAAAEIRSGKLIALGLSFDGNGPQDGSCSFRFNPRLEVTESMTPFSPAVPDLTFRDDVVHMPLQAATHWDALAHAHYKGVLYNNCPACEVLTDAGVTRMGAENLAKPGVVSRGILLDIARLKKVDRLPANYLISNDELRECCEQQGVEPQKGDIVLIRTGHIRWFTVDKNRATFNGDQPGVSYECAEWCADHSIAALASDNLGVEGFGMNTILEQEVPMPLHRLALCDMGMPLGEVWDLEALAEDCAADRRYAFFLAAQPIAVTGAAGAPINPIAVK